jgi:hypothetical protein
MIRSTRCRWLLAVLTGAVTMFVWGAISHMVLLKGAGFSHISDEERIVTALRTSLPGDGLYFLPSIDLKGNATPDEQAAWEARFRAGPTGMVVYHAAGDEPVSPKKLTVQLLSHIVAAAVVSYVLFIAVTTYWRRVGVAALLGVFALFAIGSIYWNWYGFPNAFFFAQAIDMIVGWALAGAAIAKLMPSARVR